MKKTLIPAREFDRQTIDPWMVSKIRFLLGFLTASKAVEMARTAVGAITPGQMVTGIDLLWEGSGVLGDALGGHTWCGTYLPHERRANVSVVVDALRDGEPAPKLLMYGVVEMQAGRDFQVRDDPNRTLFRRDAKAPDVFEQYLSHSLARMPIDRPLLYRLVDEIDVMAGWSAMWVLLQGNPEFADMLRNGDDEARSTLPKRMMTRRIQLHFAVPAFKILVARVQVGAPSLRRTSVSYPISVIGEGSRGRFAEVATGNIRMVCIDQQTGRSTPIYANPALQPQSQPTTWDATGPQIWGLENGR